MCIRVLGLLTTVLLAVASAWLPVGCDELLLRGQPLLPVAVLATVLLVVGVGVGILRRLVTVAVLGAPAGERELDVLQVVCRRGRGCCHTAGVLWALLSLAELYLWLHRPDVVGACLASMAVGFVQALLLGEFGFGLCDGWLQDRRMQLVAAR